MLRRITLKITNILNTTAFYWPSWIWYFSASMYVLYFSCSCKILLKLLSPLRTHLVPYLHYLHMAQVDQDVLKYKVKVSQFKWKAPKNQQKWFGRILSISPGRLGLPWNPSFPGRAWIPASSTGRWCPFSLGLSAGPGGPGCPGPASPWKSQTHYKLQPFVDVHKSDISVLPCVYYIFFILRCNT